MKKTNSDKKVEPRRDFLKLGLKSACLFLPLPYAEVWAQTDQGPQLQRLPKIALVIGNSTYGNSPLKNPENDARAFADTLKSFGFDVTSVLNGSKQNMHTATSAYLDQLAKRKCVGVFYYAGHGVQLAWKNYLIPVDAKISSLEDVQQEAFDLTYLMSGLTKASNPMNVVILDACRDNPFGTSKEPEQKGLSQIDAPHSTILAYATAPGNTASDGGGENGLYTENLLREIKVKDAKVEDIFKRVRLNVRKASKGSQIPWESTSLEYDYYFHPSAQETVQPDPEQAFSEERRLWEEIYTATSAAPFEDYLRRYPSGRFAELAQQQLNTLLAKEGEKRIQIAPSKGNPYTAGTAVADVGFKVGDRYRYRVSDIDTNVEKKEHSLVVTEITDKEVIFNQGKQRCDLLGNPTRHPDGREVIGVQVMPTEFILGKRWTTRFHVLVAGGMTDSEYNFVVAAKETITVPAGTFDCFRVEGTGTSRIPGRSPMSLSTKYWIAPDVCRRVVRMEQIRQLNGRMRNNVIENDRQELIAFKQT
ncbi:MAG: caspase family protein [Burkholderiales bacterium]|nr:caspase family protein [Burkholderiales bacterium]